MGAPIYPDLTAGTPYRRALAAYLVRAPIELYDTRTNECQTHLFKIVEENGMQFVERLDGAIFPHPMLAIHDNGKRGILF